MLSMAAIPILRVFLSTLSLRRATSSLNQGADTGDISIHALLAESDAINGCNPDFEGISIHALLAESDIQLESRCRYWGYFYPRSPCGERRYQWLQSRF